MYSGHAVPSTSSGGEAASDKVADASSQEGTKSVLVMSGGEGYIDFRMGESAARNTLKHQQRLTVAVEEIMIHLLVFR